MSTANTSTSVEAKPNYFWLFAWLFLAVTFIPYVTTRLMTSIFPELSREWQLVVWIVSLLSSVLGWMFLQGGGLPRVAKDTSMVIRPHPFTHEFVVYERGRYMFIPLVQTVEAQLPNYLFRFEATVENIDTQTAMLSKIGKLRVRVECKIKDDDHEHFFEKSLSRLDRLKALEASTKLDRTDHMLWKAFLSELIHDLVDDVVREVVWTWNVKDDKGDPTNDPTSLSKRRVELAQAVEVRLEKEMRAWGLELMPFLTSPSPVGMTAYSLSTSELLPKKVVIESIEINFDMIKGKMRNYDRELKRATEDATIQAAIIRAKGRAEAEVRAVTLAKLLDVLINQQKIPYTDPLIAKVVRAALHDDNERIWMNMPAEPPPTGAGQTKTP
ncbi:MAG: hypothetical protein WCP31_04735 [Chloroflexales bacterium]